jgi:hypothetical protein
MLQRQSLLSIDRLLIEPDGAKVLAGELFFALNNLFGIATRPRQRGQPARAERARLHVRAGLLFALDLVDRATGQPDVRQRIEELWVRENPGNQPKWDADPWRRGLARWLVDRAFEPIWESLRLESPAYQRAVDAFRNLGSVRAAAIRMAKMHPATADEARNRWEARLLGSRGQAAADFGLVPPAHKKAL